MLFQKYFKNFFYVLVNVAQEFSLVNFRYTYLIVHEKEMLKRTIFPLNIMMKLKNSRQLEFYDKISCIEYLKIAKNKCV